LAACHQLLVGTSNPRGPCFAAQLTRKGLRGARLKKQKNDGNVLKAMHSDGRYLLGIGRNMVGRGSRGSSHLGAGRVGEEIEVGGIPEVDGRSSCLDTASGGTLIPAFQAGGRSPAADATPQLAGMAPFSVTTVLQRGRARKLGRTACSVAGRVHFNSGKALRDPWPMSSMRAPLGSFLRVAETRRSGILGQARLSKPPVRIRDWGITDRCLPPCRTERRCERFYPDLGIPGTAGAGMSLNAGTIKLGARARPLGWAHASGLEQRQIRSKQLPRATACIQVLAAGAVGMGGNFSSEAPKELSTADDQRFPQARAAG